MITLPQQCDWHKGVELVPKELMKKKKERVRRQLKNCDMVKRLKQQHANRCFRDAGKILLFFFTKGKILLYKSQTYFGTMLPAQIISQSTLGPPFRGLYLFDLFLGINYVTGQENFIQKFTRFLSHLLLILFGSNDLSQYSVFGKILQKISTHPQTCVYIDMTSHGIVVLPTPSRQV